MKRTISITLDPSNIFRFGYDLLFNYYIYNNAMKDQTKYLKDFFLTSSGLSSLLKLYISAETTTTLEPSIIIDRKNEDYSIFAHDVERDKQLTSIMQEDTGAIAELEQELMEHLEESAKYNSDRILAFLSVLKQFKKGEGDYFEIYSHFVQYFSLKCKRLTSNDGSVQVHIHPQKTFTYNGQSGPVTIRTSKGYSHSDRVCSYLNPLGLVEYSQNVTKDPAELNLDFEISHRTFIFEEEIGKVNFKVGMEKFDVVDLDGVLRTYSIIKIKQSRPLAYSTLLSQPALLPFIEFDPNEDLEVFYKDFLIKNPSVLQKLYGHASEDEYIKCCIGLDMEKESGIISILRKVWGDETIDSVLNPAN